ncbi:hypothetical protein C8Q80DRAFT_380761 [Daedaleopsis nitida]|nr:hypothetical protein C8Q80DRAFT_380761 [Daedaleopsis nitida]
MSTTPNHGSNVANAMIPTAMTPPLLRMPTEVLGMILQVFTSPLEHESDEFKPHWCSSVVDCSALEPVSQTCRRLRDVVQSLPSVMKNVVVTESVPLDCDRLQARSKDISLNVYISFFYHTPPQLGDWYTSEVSRIQELHLNRLGHLSLDYWTRLLSVSWLPPKGPFLTLPTHTPELRHLTLRGVCFLPVNHLTSLTHLALYDLFVPQCHINILKVLAHCHNLESLVLSNVRESLEGRSSPPPELCLPHLRRVTLHQPPVSRKLSLYFSSLPRAPHSALQLLDFPNESHIIWPLVSKYSPGAHTLCITHHSEPRVGSESTESAGRTKRTLNPDRGALSVTTIGGNGAFHAMVPISSRRYFAPMAMLKDVLSDKPSLANVREAWLVEVRATKPIFDHDHDSAMPMYILSDSSITRHRLAVAVRPEIAALPALEVLVHVSRHSLEPNLYMLPSTKDASFVSRNLKTLKLVIGHGLGKKKRPSLNRPVLKLARVAEGLATGNYAFLDTLILQVARNVVVDNEEMLAIQKFVPTVKIERIAAVPESPIPEYCKDPVARSSWLGALW